MTQSGDRRDIPSPRSASRSSFSHSQSDSPTAASPTTPSPSALSPSRQRNAPPRSRNYPVQVSKKKTGHFGPVFAMNSNFEEKKTLLAVLRRRIANKPGVRAIRSRPARGDRRHVPAQVLPTRISSINVSFGAAPAVAIPAPMTMDSIASDATDVLSAPFELPSAAGRVNSPRPYVAALGSTQIEFRS